MFSFENAGLSIKKNWLDQRRSHFRSSSIEGYTTVPNCPLTTLQIQYVVCLLLLHVLT